jgi:hypothetical protein
MSPEISQDNIQRSLGRIEGKLDSLVFALTEHTKDDALNFSIVDRQIDSLQRLTWMALGVISFLGISVPAAIAYFK